MSRNVEKITVDMQQDRLPQDLERYRQHALEPVGHKSPRHGEIIPAAGEK